MNLFDKKNFQKYITKRSNLLIVVIFVGFILISILLIKHFFIDEFWLDFMANFFATILGIIIGVPASILINTFQNAKEENERKNKIIKLLHDELIINQIHISSWKNSENRNYEALTLHAIIRTELWSTFSDGGELEWINDLDVLNALSDVYFALDSICLISKMIFELESSAHKSRDISNYLSILLEKGIDYTQEALENAFPLLRTDL
jgi:hypothetical protein